MSFYGNLRKTAQRLLREKGQSAILQYPGPATGSPQAPVYGSPVEVPCLLVELNYSVTGRDISSVQIGDKMGIIAPEIPALDSLRTKLIMGGAIYHLLYFEPFSPGGTILFYEYQARK